MQTDTKVTSHVMRRLSVSIDQTPSTAPEERLLLSYLTPEEKHRLVGSFVVENFWDTFIEENRDPIDRFRQLAKESIPAFIEAYQDVWDYVIDVNKLDDQFVYEGLRKNEVLKGLSLEELILANKLLSLSLYSELEKDCLMALNKTILGELAVDMKTRYELSDEEYQLLMTPSFETFFVKYHFDHFEYTVNDDPETKEEQRKSLIRNFHANDPDLFELRYAEMHFPTGENLGAMLEMQKAALAQRAAKKAAFIEGREDFIAFEKLLEYDNFLDFEYRYNLEACPEYYLRKVLFAACQEEGIFADVEKPLSLQDQEFIAGVNKLIKIRENSYVIGLGVDFGERGEGALADIQEVSAEGTRAAILKKLKQGSPCLVRSVHGDGEVMIVGYEGESLLALNRLGNLTVVSEEDIDLSEGVTVFQKYEPKFIESLNQSADVFVARTPYLDRSSYEHAFKAGM